MKHFAFFVLTSLLFSCSTEPGQKKIIVQEPVAQSKPDTTTYVFPFEADSIQGDFNGDGKREWAFSAIVKDQKGSPQDGGTQAEYAIRFSDERMQPVNVSCCEFRLFNEGDLDDNGTDEFSIFQHPLNGCTEYMQTYTYKNKMFQPFIEGFVVPTACNYFSDSVVQAIVVRQNGKVYLFNSNANLDLVKTEAKVLK